MVGGIDALAAFNQRQDFASTDPNGIERLEHGLAPFRVLSKVLQYKVRGAKARGKPHATRPEFRRRLILRTIGPRVSRPERRHFTLRVGSPGGLPVFLPRLRPRCARFTVTLNTLFNTLGGALRAQDTSGQTLWPYDKGSLREPFTTVRR